jgi:uncharacterized phage protein (TIGR02218 family)
MRQLSPALQSLISGSSVTTLAKCYRVTRPDAVVMGWTDHDLDLTFAGITFTAAPGIDPSQLTWNSDGSVDNLDIQGAFIVGQVQERDVYAGKYDLAAVDIFEVDYTNLPATLAPSTVIWLRSGYIGEIKTTPFGFWAEVRGTAQKLTQVVGDLTSSSCRYNFCDANCTLTASSFQESGTVASVIGNRVISCAGLTQPVNAYQFGTVTWLTGANAGTVQEIGSSDVGLVRLFERAPYTIAVGDSVRAFQGCPKTVVACGDRFSNAVNFGGEPHVPGYDYLLAGFINGGG